MVWGTYAVKIEVKNGHLLVLRRVLRLARMLCALMYGDLANLLKSARKKSAPECPNRGDANLGGASLNEDCYFPEMFINMEDLKHCRCVGPQQER